MHLPVFDYFGVVAYLLICSFYPLQIWQIYVKRNVAGVPITTLWILFFGNLFMVISTTQYSKYLLYEVGAIICTIATAAMVVGYYIYRKK
jgi:hypothetical protein